MPETAIESTSTTFKAKAYGQFAVLVAASALLFIVMRTVEQHFSSEESAVIQWVILAVALIVVLSAISTIHRHWVSFALTGEELQIRHKIYGVKEIELSQIASAEIKDTQGGRGHRYASIEIKLTDGKTVLLDGLYNVGMEPILLKIQTAVR